MVTTEDDVVQRALDLYQRDKEHWDEVYRRAREDLHFLSDDPFAQWDQGDYVTRTNLGRPALTIDQLGQFIHQVVNDIRQNTPSINVIPNGGEADEDTAEIYKGLIRNIEYVSSADDAYDTAANFSVKSSIGFITVDHDYCEDDGFNQELLIKRVINPAACLIDCESIEPDGRDAKHGFIIDKLTLDDFKKQFPGKDPVSFEDAKLVTTSKNGDYVAVAQFYELIDNEKIVGLLPDGTTEEMKEGVPYSATRKVKSTKVKRYKLSGQDVLEETSFPGCYIPIVPVYGEEAWIEGKRHILSLIRKSKQAQQMYNLWKSLETELLMKQPHAPVMAPAGSVEAYATDWQNPGKSMVLRYDTEKNGKPLPTPERLAPPPIPTGIVNAARETVDDIKATMGIYNASLGAKSNETSGVAINQRKIEGDVATYHFGDNLVKSITQVGRILVNAIPEIYDASRILRIIGEEDEPKEVGVNGASVEDQERHFDLTKGKYGVRVTTGASFTTRRQETVAALNDLFKASPELMQVFGDIYFKNSDFAGAQAMANRAEKLLPPQLKDDQKQDPQVIQLQQQLQQAQQIIQQGAQEMQQLQQQLKSKDAETAVKAQDNERYAQIDAMKAQIDEFKALMDVLLQNRALDIQEQQLMNDAAAQAAAHQLQEQQQVDQAASQFANQGKSP